jgi:ABC-type Na+ efflux pump permease subunit
MMAISNLYLTHSVMMLCALAATFMAVPESTGGIVAWWRIPTTALLAVISALALVSYPTWGELKNPGLWMFAIVAAVTGVARAYWMQIDVGGVLSGWTGGCRGVSLQKRTAGRSARPSFAAA